MLNLGTKWNYRSKSIEPKRFRERREDGEDEGTIVLPDLIQVIRIAYEMPVEQSRNDV
jgi:hypothetical protein